MATPVVMTGTIRAASVMFGPTNDEFKIDKTTGQVDFAVGTPTPTTAQQFPLLGGPTYSTLPSTNITAATKNVDAVNVLNNWLGQYLLDSPPAVTNLTAAKDTTKIHVTWTLPPQKKLAFSQTTAPYINAVKADFILHANNLDGSWTNAFTTVTVESPAANAFATVTTLDLHVAAGTSSLSGTTYSYRAIETETAYDVRVYCTNLSDQPLHYAAFVANVATDKVGPPAAPTSLAMSAITQTGATANWTAPADRDANLAGTQTTPFIGQYRLDRSTTSSARYGGAITDTASDLTAATTSSDAVTSLVLSGVLKPGTNYNFNVYAMNTINGSYGAASNTATALTQNPTANAFLSASDSTAIDTTQLTALRSPYLSSGGYTLGGTVAPVVLNAANMTTNATFLTYTGLRRTNFAIGATGTVGSLVAYAGPTASYTNAANTASFSTQGFGTTTADGSVTSSGGTSTLLYKSDGDQYGSAPNTGFYKVVNATAQAASPATNFPPASTSYSLRLEYTPAGGSLAQTNRVDFWVDGLNAATSISDLAIIGESGSNTTQISGVPTFTSTAAFRAQWCQTNVASYFVRSDRKHADLSLTDATGATTLGAVVPVLSTSMGATHRYYTAPASNKYATSTTLSNTTGTQLAYTLTPEEIQFNTFIVSLTAASTAYDESIKAKATPFSMYTNAGTSRGAGFIDPATGTAKTVRIDAPSITVKNTTLANAANALGQHVSSGSGTNPAASAHTTYDHTQSLLSNNDLQLLAGRFVTPAGDAAAYKDYSTCWSGAAGLATPNYSTTITSASSSYRYVTFKYTGKITAGQSKLQLTVVSTGLTLGANLSSANHTLTVRVEDGAQPTEHMDCNSAVSASGLGTVSPVPAATPCGDVATTVSSRRVYIQAGATTSAVVYVRFGVPCNVAATITSCSLAAVTIFT